MILHYGGNTYVLERIARIDRKDHENSLAVAVVSLCDGFVLLLARSIPDLQFDARAIDSDNFEDVVDADGHHVVIDEHALGVPEQDVALAHSRVPDDDYFLDVVEGLLHLPPPLQSATHYQYY